GRGAGRRSRGPRRARDRRPAVSRDGRADRPGRLDGSRAGGAGPAPGRERPRREGIAMSAHRGAAAMLGHEGILAATIPHYEDRPEQRQMAAAVAEAIEYGGAIMIEAGTGTGKTLAYLVPALLSK